MKKTVIFLIVISFFTACKSRDIKQEEEIFTRTSDLETRILKLGIELKDVDSQLAEIKEYNSGIREGITVLKINDEVIQDETLKLERNIEDIRDYYSVKTYIEKQVKN